MSAVEGWDEVNHRLVRTYAFNDFKQAKAFIDAVSEVCEQQQHHAELSFGWGYAVIEMYSHDEGGITQRDVVLATAINNLEASM